VLISIECTSASQDTVTTNCALELLQSESCGYVHALQLLEEQLARIRQADVGHLLATPTALTPTLITQQPTVLAYSKGNMYSTVHKRENTLLDRYTVVISILYTDVQTLATNASEEIMSLSISRLEAP
jgi:hypothetical protein